MPVSAPTRVRWVEQRPEPARFWIRWRPRGWPPPPHDWTDLAAGALGDPGGEAGGGLFEPGLPAPPGSAGDDVVWLPPVPAALEAARLRLAGELAEGGSPVLLQVTVEAEARGPSGARAPTAAGAAASIPGKPVSLPESEVAALAAAGVTVVLDPLPVLLAAGAAAGGERLVEVAAAIPGAAAAWPLLSGLTDGAEEVRRAVKALATAGLAAVQPLALRLSGPQRRRLAENRGAEEYDALFHRAPPAERPFARAAAAAGVAFLLPRPLPRRPRRGARTRRLAGLLALAGELWLRCGRPPEAGQGLLRAARWADGAGYDLAALAREGNLAVVPSLDERARGLLAEAARGEEPALLRELLAEYAADDEEDHAAAGTAGAEEVEDG